MLSEEEGERISEKLISEKWLRDYLDDYDTKILEPAALQMLNNFYATLIEAPAVDAVEVVQKEAVDYGYLADWYIISVTNDLPVWTEEHIEELFNDFYLVPKGERREENADDIGKSD